MAVFPSIIEEPEQKQGLSQLLQVDAPNARVLGVRAVSVAFDLELLESQLVGTLPYF